MNLNHTVLHLGVIAESNNGQIWIDRQIISYELLCSFVNPLPPTVSVHFCWSLHDQDILKTKIKSARLAKYCRKWPESSQNGKKQWKIPVAVKIDLKVPTYILVEVFMTKT